MLFLPLIIVLVIILNIFVARSNKTTKPFDSFIEEERLANSSRKKDIPKELYLQVNKDILPFAEYNKDDPQYSQLARAQEKAAKKIKLAMLRLPKRMTNNEIKLAFGIANFENIVALEENYSDCLNALILWAEELINSEKLAEAETVLLETINLKSEYSKSYTLLCDIYLKTNNRKKMIKLIEIIEDDGFMDYNIPIKNKIRDYAGSIYAKMEENV